MENNNRISPQATQFIVKCPNCQVEIIIEEVNCRIFRHAVNKATGEQMNPHASKTECDEAVSKDTIYGCAAPFIIDLSGNEWVAVSCDYI
jgi:hypothetical protein